MIKLENVLEYDNHLAYWSKNMSSEESKFIKDKKLKKFSQLEEIILKGEEVPNNFIKLYELVISHIGKENLKFREFLFCNNNLLDIINERDLEITEEETLVKNLILNAVLNTTWRVTFDAIEKLNIRNLRFFLNHVTPNGKNSLEVFPKIGTSALDKVVKTLSFYEEQIKRQYKERHVIGTNLFTLNQKEKQAIVVRELPKYIEYFLSTSNDFIWGKRTESNNRLLEECLNKETKISLENKKRLIETLTNYTTLEELENGAIENHTLDRFMLTKTIEKDKK